MDAPRVDPGTRERLLRLARGLGHGAEDAEDLVQDCFVALYRGGFRGDASLGTWLHRVLLNKHFDEVRRGRRRSAPPPPTASPSARLEERECVRQAIRRLPEAQQAVLVLRYFEELSYAEISDILGRPEGTLRADCCRGLESLQEILVRTHGESNVREWL